MEPVDHSLLMLMADGSIARAGRSGSFRIEGKRSLIDADPTGAARDKLIPGYRLVFDEDFDGQQLDARRWIPHHLPHWSSSDKSRASYRIFGGSLVLFIGENQPCWCPEFDGNVRVSALQTGRRSGKLGTVFGQHRFRPGLRVRETQIEERLYTPIYGRIVLRARARLAASSLASLYLIGFEEIPQNSGEITVMEVFGKSIDSDGAVVGRGLKNINDDRLRTDFTETKLPISIEDWHVYEADWSQNGVKFLLDGELIGSAAQSPDYAMQLMLTLYDLSPEGSVHDPSPEFEIDYIRGYEPVLPFVPVDLQRPTESTP